MLKQLDLSVRSSGQGDKPESQDWKGKMARADFGDRLARQTTGRVR